MEEDGVGGEDECREECSEVVATDAEAYPVDRCDGEEGEACGDESGVEDVLLGGVVCEKEFADGEADHLEPRAGWGFGDGLLRVVDGDEWFERKAVWGDGPEEFVGFDAGPDGACFGLFDDVATVYFGVDGNGCDGETSEKKEPNRSFVATWGWSGKGAT